MGLRNVFDFNDKMNQSIHGLFGNILKENLKNPSQAAFLLQAISAQKKAAKRRQKNEKQGIHVPAFMIASITHRCNLKCKGCYAQAQHRDQSGETDFTRLKGMVDEAHKLGISIILLAGGEPLVRKKEIIEIAKAHRDIIFPIFTNGLMIDDELMDSFRSLKNAVPVISIEGLEADTDQRRGAGVYNKVKSLFKDLQRNDILYGTSITVTSENIDTVTDKTFIQALIGDGCKVFVFVEYVPVEEGTDRLILNENHRNILMERVQTLRASLPASFIAFPGDEKDFGGCIASGRGFIHISPEGNVEPCPFAPFSDSSLRDKSLKECIQSDFLKKIRDNHALLVEHQGGCALWENRELVQTYLAK